jgi:hypothetical protein
MCCPDDVAEVLTAILQTGLLRIRASAWANESERCAIEADHLHNLPSLLAQYSPDLLRYYWVVERTAFLNQSADQDVSSFEPLWNQLERLLKQYAIAVKAG